MLDEDGITGSGSELVAARLSRRIQGSNNHPGEVIPSWVTNPTHRFEQEYQFEYTFYEDQQVWITDFADLLADYDQNSYELETGLH